MVTRSPSRAMSMRSPGPYPGRPHTHSSSRSSRSCRSVTPRSAAAPATAIPGRASRYGTRLSSRPSRSADPVMVPPVRGGDLVEPFDDEVADLRRVEDARVRSVPDELRGQPLGVAVAQRQPVAVVAVDDLVGVPAQARAATLADQDG